MNKVKILMTYKNTEGLEKLLNHPQIQVDIKPKPSPEEFVNLIKGYDGLLIRSEVKVVEQVINNADKLKVICRAGTGIDNVDIKAATKKGIVVMNVPGGNTISACEHTIGLILSMMRNIPQAHSALKAGLWEREKFTGSELQGKILGLLGLGRIGSEVAKRMLSFGMKVIAYDPYVSEDHGRQIGVEIKSLEEVLSLSDIISLHLPKTDDTKNLLNKETFKKMKDGVKIVNCARGGIVNEQDLAEALKSGKISAAALDVFEKEPTTSSPLFELPNIVVTPHLGASTEEAQIKIATEVAEMFIDYFFNNVTRNAVNIPTCDLETINKLQPYIYLMEKLGLFHGQFVDGGVKEINIEYAGNFQQLNTYMLTSSYVKNFLSCFVDIEHNLVNAPVIAKERGIKVTETKVSEGKEIKESVTIKIVTDKETSSILGTIFAEKNLRIVEINDIYTDIEPVGYILSLTNTDKPGIIGKVGTLLGENGINIAKMFVARDKQGGNAMTFINIDNEISKDVLNKISNIEGVSRVKFIKS
ncbi:MAG: phosphoglycerate dehydrogenase [Endomicrobiia bacterium]